MNTVHVKAVVVLLTIPSFFYLSSPEDPFHGETWGPNVEEFKRRFDPVTSDGEGPVRLKNLYFTYLVVLRAIAKAAPLLEKEAFYTGVYMRYLFENLGAGPGSPTQKSLPHLFRRTLCNSQTDATVGEGSILYMCVYALPI